MDKMKKLRFMRTASAVLFALIVVIFLAASIHLLSDGLSHGMKRAENDSQENERRALQKCEKLCGEKGIKAIEYTFMSRTLKSCECR